MKKYMLLMTLLSIPLQGFCNRFYASNSMDIYDDLAEFSKKNIEIVKITPVPINEMGCQYIIEFK